MLDWRQGGRLWCCCGHQVRSGGQDNRSKKGERAEGGGGRERASMAPRAPSGQTGRANDRDTPGYWFQTVSLPRRGTAGSSIHGPGAQEAWAKRSVDRHPAVSAAPLYSTAAS